jgi:hypothetical protein
MSSVQGRVRICRKIKKINYKQKIVIWMPRCTFVNVVSIEDFIAHVGKTEGKSLIGRPKNRCEDNFKHGLEEIVPKGVGEL